MEEVIKEEVIVEETEIVEEIIEEVVAEEVITDEIIEETVEVEEPEDEIMGYADPKIPDLENMNPNEIRDWAKSNGYGSIIRNTRSKDKLIELIRG